MVFSSDFENWPASTSGIDRHRWSRGQIWWHPQKISVAIRRLSTSVIDRDTCCLLLARNAGPKIIGMNHSYEGAARMEVGV